MAAPEPFSYVEMARILAAGEDARFAVRQLRELVLSAHREHDQGRIDAIHREPATTGSTGWDAVLGGVAWMTGRDRVSDPGLLAWCFGESRYCTDSLFDPLDCGRWLWLDSLRTPVELRERNVVLAYGNLEGV